MFRTLFCNAICRQRDKHAADAGKLAIGVVEGKRQRRPVERFQFEAPQARLSEEDGKPRCPPNPVNIICITFARACLTAATLGGSRSGVCSCTRECSNTLLCCAAGLQAALAASRQDPDGPTNAQQAWLQYIAAYCALSCCFVHAAMQQAPRTVPVCAAGEEAARGRRSACGGTEAAEGRRRQAARLRRVRTGRGRAGLGGRPAAWYAHRAAASRSRAR